MTSENSQILRTAPAGALFLLHGRVDHISKGCKSACFNSTFSTCCYNTGREDCSSLTSTGPEPMEEVRREYLRLRNQQQEQAQAMKSASA